MDVQCGEEELALVQSLRAKCNGKGIELWPKSTSALLHKLGRLYCNENNDRFRLIQGIALLTSAILREPDNVVEIKWDIDEACEKVLRLASSSQSAAYMEAAVSDIKERIKRFREETKSDLENVAKISDDVWDDGVAESRITKVNTMVLVQQRVSETFTSIMRQVSDYCSEALGPAPCIFSLVGLGSLSRKDITTFSDFEHAIVLPDEVASQESYSYVLNYFRWFATLFQVILVRLGETLLSFLAIPSLNHPSNPEHNWFFDDFTVCGISPDGMAPSASKTALGCPTIYITDDSSELIKSCGDMVAHFCHTEDFQRQLLAPCFVSGNSMLFKTFKTRLANNRTPFTNTMYNRLVDEHFQRFNFFKILKRLAREERFDVKRVLYRSITLYLAALGRFYRIENPCCFDIVDRLYNMGMIDSEYRVRLKFCVAVSCEVRLRFYTEKQSQDDILMQSQFYQERRHLQDIVESVGAKTLVEAVVFTCEFQTNFSRMINFSSGVYPITYVMEKQFLFVLLLLCNRLKLYSFCNKVVNTHPQRLDLTSKEDLALLAYFELDSLKGMKKFAQAVQFGKRSWKCLLSQPSISVRYKVPFVFILGVSLHYNRMYKAALRKFRKVNFYYHKAPLEEHNYISLYGQMSSCFLSLGRYAKGLKYAKRELESVQEKYEDPKYVCEYYDALYNMGMCFRGLKMYDQCKATLRSAIELKETYLPSRWTDIRVKQCFLELGACSYEQGMYTEALNLFDTAMETNVEENDYELDMQGYRIIMGNCLSAVDRDSEAIDMFKKALEDFQQLNLSRRKHAQQKTAMCFHQMALCASKTGNHEEALEYYWKAKQFFESCDMSKFLEQGRFIFTLGRLHQKSGKFGEALKTLLTRQCRRFAATSEKKSVSYHDILYECYKALGDQHHAEKHRETANKLIRQINWTEEQNISESFHVKLKLDFVNIDNLYAVASYREVVMNGKRLLNDVSRLGETRQSCMERVASVVYIAISLNQLGRYGESIRASEKTLELAFQVYNPLFVVDDMEGMVQLHNNIWRCGVFLGQDKPLDLDVDCTPSILCHISNEVRRQNANDIMEQI